MSRFSAFLDTCVLVPIATADLLLRLAEAGLFRPLWSAAILDELERALISVHPDLASGGAQRRVEQMTHAFIDAQVTGWESITENLDLPDPDDNHVLAAAIAGRADIIVTNNIRHFPDLVLNQHGLEAQSLDEFLLNQLDLSRDVTLRVLTEQAQAARRPPLAPAELLQDLERSGVPSFATEAATQLWRTQPHARRGRS